MIRRSAYILTWNQGLDHQGPPLYAWEDACAWGATDWIDQAKRFPNAFRAMRWMLRRHAFPREYLALFRAGTWRVIRADGQGVLFM